MGFLIGHDVVLYLGDDTANNLNTLKGDIMESLIISVMAAIWLALKVSEMRSRQSMHDAFKALAIDLVK
jgi:hypothetical protein